MGVSFGFPEPLDFSALEKSRPVVPCVNYRDRADAISFISACAESSVAEALDKKTGHDPSRHVVCTRVVAQRSRRQQLQIFQRQNSAAAVL